ncbi:MAG TPA: hypothetical protein VHM02_00585 [Thermoanaerobaculia bacterium]|nr:hypothetical protein [Thermoanaerobaculia bacterium]
MSLAGRQSLALAVAIAGGVLGFLASLGFFFVPLLPPWALWLAHPLVVVAGLVAGRSAVERGREADRARWEVADEPLATAAEREHAHKEAERERRIAGTVFLAAPVFLGYWGLYQFGAGGPGSWALPVSGLLGFLAGYGIESRRGGPERRH